MPIWVKLNSIQYVSEKGKQKRYNPGDWVQVGRQQAQVWMAQGAAEIPNLADYYEALTDGAGIVTNNIGKTQELLRGLGATLEVRLGRPEVAYEHTVWWDTSLKLRPNLLGVGLYLLKTWEIAIPFEDYNRLAAHVGTEEERETTRKVIRDLRVPLYSTRLIFARRVPHIIDLIDDWQNDIDNGCNSELSLLRSIYRVKPFILALPTTWVEGRPSGV